MITVSDEEPDETTPINFFENLNEYFSVFDSSSRLEMICMFLFLFFTFLIKKAIHRLTRNRSTKLVNQPAPSKNVNLQDLQNGLGILAAAAESLNHVGNSKQENPLQCKYCKVILRTKQGFVSHQKRCEEIAKQQSRCFGCFCC